MTRYEEILFAIARIQDECESALEEELAPDNYWYALGCIQVISQVAIAALDNVPEAAVADLPLDARGERDRKFDHLRTFFGALRSPGTQSPAA